MADPDLIFTEGFDKYAEYTDNAVSVQGSAVSLSAALTAGEWTTVSPGGSQSVGGIGPSLAGAGGAYVQSSSDNVHLHKGLGGTYNRVIGGCHVRRDATTAAEDFAIALGQSISTVNDAGCMLSIVIDGATGNLELRRGGQTETLIVSVGAQAPLNTAIRLAWDLAPVNSGGYAKVWVNETLVINETGDMNAETGDGFQDIVFGFLGQFALDHLYCWFFSSATASGEVPAAGAPIIVTDKPNGTTGTPASVATAAILGEPWFTNTVSSGNFGASTVVVRRWVAPASGDLTKLYYPGGSASGAAKIRACVYSDNAGAPNSLLASSAEQTGVSGNLQEFTLSSPLAVTKGTVYWIGFHADTALTARGHGNTSTATSVCVSRSQTYASGLPATFGAATARPSYSFFGLIENVTVRADCLTTPAGEITFNKSGYVRFDAAGEIDTYTFPDLPVDAQTVHCVALKARTQKSASGALTYDIESDEGATVDNGSAGSFSPSTSNLGMAASYWFKNPRTAAQWTVGQVNDQNGRINVLTLV